MQKESKEKPFMTGGHLRPSHEHGPGCGCHGPKGDFDEDEDEEDNAGESGNILWFILIGVALLAALTLVISRGSSSVDQSGDYEQNSVKAAQIMRYAKGIEAAVGRLKLNGCSENDISFENSVDANYVNPNSPADQSCHVFEPEGGGMSYLQPKDGWLDSAQSAETGYGELFITAQGEVTDVVTDCDAAACMDLLLFVPYLREDLCLAINARLGNVPSYSGAPPAEDNNVNPANARKFIGTFPNGGNWDGTNGARTFDALYSACIEDDGNGGGSGRYFFYQVLLAR